MEGRYTYGFRYDTPLAAYLSGRWQALCVSTIIIMSERAWMWTDLLRSRGQRWGCDSYTGPLVLETAETLTNLPQPQDTLQTPKFHQLWVWSTTVFIWLDGYCRANTGIDCSSWAHLRQAKCKVLVPEVPRPGVRGSFYNTEHGFDFFFKGHCLEWNEPNSMFSDFLSAVLSREICSLGIMWITINAEDD